MEEGWRRMTMHKSTIVKNTIVESLSVILAALMLTACGANTNTETDVKVLEETEIVEATPEETSEVQSTPKENNSEAVEKPVVTATVEEEEALLVSNLNIVPYSYDNEFELSRDMEATIEQIVLSYRQYQSDLASTEEWKNQFASMFLQNSRYDIFFSALCRCRYDDEKCIVDGMIPFKTQ